MVSEGEWQKKKPKIENLFGTSIEIHIRRKQPNQTQYTPSTVEYAKKLRLPREIHFKN